jgi:hypothetical protein
VLITWFGFDGASQVASGCLDDSSSMSSIVLGNVINNTNAGGGKEFVEVSDDEADDEETDKTEGPEGLKPQPAVPVRNLCRKRTAVPQNMGKSDSNNGNNSSNHHRPQKKVNCFMVSLKCYMLSFYGKI